MTYTMYVLKFCFYIYRDIMLVLVEETKIMERWRSYFSVLFNGERSEYPLRLERRIQEGHQNDKVCSRISKEEVNDALRNMELGKVVGPGLIFVGIWKCLGDAGLEWLTELFNIIFRTVKIPSEWRTCIVITLYKNEGNIQDCNNYWGIKLLRYMMKLWEKDH